MTRENDRWKNNESNFNFFSWVLVCIGFEFTVRGKDGNFHNEEAQSSQVQPLITHSWRTKGK